MTDISSDREARGESDQLAHVTIVGGGITGLTAAWDLSSRRPDLVIDVHESTGSWGGKLKQSVIGSSGEIDEGADAFLARVPEGTELCRELGMEGTLVSPATSHAYVWSRGQLRSLPTGVVLGVPTSIAALRRSGVVPWAGVARAACEPLMARRASKKVDTDSIGEVITSRFGHHVTQRLVDPLLGGINAGNADFLSLAASAPQLLATASSPRSMMRALRSVQRPDGPVFFSPTGGMAQIAEKLVDQLGQRGVGLHLRSPISQISGPTIVATPAFAAANLLATVAPQTAQQLRAVEYVSVALVTIEVLRSSISHALDGSGFLVPRVTGTLLTACSWSSTKWAHIGNRSADTVIMRLSAGRLGDRRVDDFDDDRLVTLMLAELRPMIGMTGDPGTVRVSRWHKGFPQYFPGHLGRITALESTLAHEAPHIQMAGAAYRGVGVPACIRSGRRASGEMVAWLDR